MFLGAVAESRVPSGNKGCEEGSGVDATKVVSPTCRASEVGSRSAPLRLLTPKKPTSHRRWVATVRPSQVTVAVSRASPGSTSQTDGLVARHQRTLDVPDDVVDEQDRRRRATNPASGLGEECRVGSGDGSPRTCPGR